MNHGPISRKSFTDHFLCAWSVSYGGVFADELTSQRMRPGYWGPVSLNSSLYKVVVVFETGFNGTTSFYFISLLFFGLCCNAMARNVSIRS